MINLTAINRRPRVLNILHWMGLSQAITDTTEAELNCLANHASGRRKALEIGTFMGVSAIRIGKAIASDGTLYCLDPYGSEKHPNFQIARRGLSRNHVLSKIHFIDGTSETSEKEIPSSLDFIFVDGDHSWQGIETDWALVRMKLALDGIVCFHDTTHQDDGVWHESMKFFSEVVRNDDQFEVIETCDSLNVCRRVSE